jgi:type III secretion protein J
MRAPVRRLARGVSLLAAAALVTGCAREALYSDLTEEQANQVQAALLGAGMDAHKDSSSKGKVWSISVGRRDIPRAMSVLAAAGLPHQPLYTLGEVFAKAGFVSSPLEERARYVFALSQELEHTLMQLDGVVDASVHIALPERNMLDDKPPSASAAVVIIERPGADIEARETDIKAIVTDGTEGLSNINRVTVKFFTRRPATRTLTAAPSGPEQTSWPGWRLFVAGAAGLLAFGFIGGGFIGGAGLRLLHPRHGRAVWRQFRRTADHDRAG